MPPARALILVVDDDPDMRGLLRSHLAGAGYEVAEAESAAAAHERLAERVPHLIVSDISMPETNGVEFVANLRKESVLAQVPVIYLTSLEPNTELAVRTLGYPLLSKPVNARELLALVKRQLRAPGRETPEG